MLDPEFIEWLYEGTREEIHAKNRRFINHLRENPEDYTFDPEWLDAYEAKLNLAEITLNSLRMLERELAVTEYEKNECYRQLDELLLKEENLPTLPVFGKRRKDSH